MTLLCIYTPCFPKCEKGSPPSQASKKRGEAALCLEGKIRLIFVPPGNQLVDRTNVIIFFIWGGEGEGGKGFNAQRFMEDRFNTETPLLQ